MCFCVYVWVHSVMLKNKKESGKHLFSWLGEPQKRRANCHNIYEEDLFDPCRPRPANAEGFSPSDLIKALFSWFSCFVLCVYSIYSDFYNFYVSSITGFPKIWGRGPMETSSSNLPPPCFAVSLVSCSYLLKEEAPLMRNGKDTNL